MRQYIKKQCLATLDTLNEAHEDIASIFKAGNMGATMELLEQCQQGAISIGEVIEEHEGEGTKAVRLLEKYCERVYELYGQIERGETVNIRQAVRQFRGMLDKVTNELNNTIPTQREVVFLPYKASMWDSLESMWRISKDDKGTTAVVVPIPYYDKNPDGSFREIHYEIDLFPADVPVVRYDRYDLAKRHPDTVIIHNPYDECNYVTSVDPMFYTKELKKHTDELIYIPYFILGDIDPYDPDALMGVKHFVLTPGVIHADRVIVESEDMKKVYVDILTAHSSSKLRKQWEQKISGLGSPKVERVINLRYEDFDMPESWEKLIYTEDGTKKKVILYNTSVNAAIKYGADMLAKIRRSLCIFKKYEGKIVLIWRPHPLTEATIKAMYPGLWDGYHEVIEGYRNAGWGIYDDSPDMHTAIAVSDAYYGDESSVVWLYKKTGKPIMIQECNRKGDL